MRKGGQEQRGLWRGCRQRARWKVCGESANLQPTYFVLSMDARPWMLGTWELWAAHQETLYRS